MSRFAHGPIPQARIVNIDDPPGHASEKAMMIAIFFSVYLARCLLAMMIAILGDTSQARISGPLAAYCEAREGAPARACARGIASTGP
jgi:hypothetical protein